MRLRRGNKTEWASSRAEVHREYALSETTMSAKESRPLRPPLGEIFGMKMSKPFVVCIIGVESEVWGLKSEEEGLFIGGAAAGGSSWLLAISC